jgi:hypothetical protein
LRCGVSFSQFGSSLERSVIKSMDKHRWEKAESKLRKALAKDTLNTSVRYLLSTFYFRSDNPAFDLDSAYDYAVGAFTDYSKTSPRQKEKLRRMALDSLSLIRMRQNIDSAAFEHARDLNTEGAYLRFLSHNTSASQRELATELRDEVAFQEAAKANTHQAFFAYLHKYPGAKRAVEARQFYDRLLYHAETRDMKLASFEKFLSSHPDTPYRKEIYGNIFELSTADGSVESFLAFMERYPDSDLVKRAGQLIFYILADEEHPQWPGRFMNDSLQNLQAVQNTYLVPILKNGLYGFINENGKEIIRPEFEDIFPDYLCGNITDDVLILDNKLIARNGSLVYEGQVDEISELGIGFLKIRTKDGHKLIHKAGFIFADSIQDARVLNKRYVALKRDSVWKIYTLTGRQLDPVEWEDITSFHDNIIFKKNDKVYIAPKKQLDGIADGLPVKLSEPFDEVRNWPYELIWVRSGEFQGVLNYALQTVMRFDKHTLRQSFFGAIATVPNGFNLYNWAGQEASTFEQVNIYGPWVAVQKRQSWYLFEPHLQEIESQAYDRIKAEGPFVIGWLTDTAYVHFAMNNTTTFIQPVKISFVPGKDSTSFLLVEDKQGKSIFDLRGRKLFTAIFDAIEYAGEGIFVVTRKDKKGLINSSGKILLPPEFDAIGSVKDKVVSLLKGKRFGAYHIGIEKTINPQYDRNLIPYHDGFLATYKEGFYGFLGWDNKPLSAFEFDEIKYWDDSIALVKKGAVWNFYNIVAKKIAENNLRNILFIKNSPDEKIAIIQKDSGYGVISSVENVIIPPSFSDIINLGSAENPLYFTEKHIAEAGLFVVIYYDRVGRMLRKEIYEDAQDYDKIYCSDN